jgi:hypothetical protein
MEFGLDTEDGAARPETHTFGLLRQFLSAGLLGAGGTMAGEIATLVSDATPYITAAAGAYGGAVLAKVRDDTANATVGLGRRLLQRVFGHGVEDTALPAPLAALAADPDDADALGMVRWMMRQALEADAAMLRDVRSILASAEGVTATQHVRAGRDAYVAGRDISIKRPND